MKKQSYIFLLLSIICVLPVYAQENDSQPPVGNQTSSEEPEEVVNVGVIAGSSRSKKKGIAEQVNYGSAPGDEESVVTGGVSHEGRDKCIAKVKNSSPKNAYSVSFSVEVSDKDGGGKTSKSFSAKVDPNGEVSRIVSCKPSDNIQVILKSARKQ